MGLVAPARHMQAVGAWNSSKLWGAVTLGLQSPSASSISSKQHPEGGPCFHQTQKSTVFSCDRGHVMCYQAPSGTLKPQRRPKDGSGR